MNEKHQLAQTVDIPSSPSDSLAAGFGKRLDAPFHPRRLAASRAARSRRGEFLRGEAELRCDATKDPVR